MHLVKTKNKKKAVLAGQLDEGLKWDIVQMSAVEHVQWYDLEKGCLLHFGSYTGLTGNCHTMVN